MPSNEKRKDPNDIKLPLAAYLASQEGKCWTGAKSRRVLQFAARFDDAIKALMIAAGICVEEVWNEDGLAARFPAGKLTSDASPGAERGNPIT